MGVNYQIKEIVMAKKILTDESIMSFGKHKGKKLEDIEDSFFVWFWNKNVSNYKNHNRLWHEAKLLMIYIEDNLDSLFDS